MPLVTNPIGPNSYCITTTQGITADHILTEIISIVKQRTHTDEPKHGWELHKVDYNKELLWKSETFTFTTVAWIKSPCVSGGTKYAALCVLDNKLTVCAAHEYSADLSSVVYLSSYETFVNGNYTWSTSTGVISHSMEITDNDRFDFVLFIHPRWLAFTTVPYSSKETTVRGENFTAFSLLGVFELYDGPHKFALFNSAMALTGEYTQGVASSMASYHMSGVAVDTTTYIRNKPGVYLCGKGEMITSVSGDYGLMDISSTIPADRVTMLDLYGQKDTLRTWKSLEKLGTMYGLKCGRETTGKLFGKTGLQCEAINYNLQEVSNEFPHIHIPTWFYSTVLQGAGFLRQWNRKASLFLPA